METEEKEAKRFVIQVSLNKEERHAFLQNMAASGFNNQSGYAKSLLLNADGGKRKADPDLKKLIHHLDDLSNIRSELNKNGITADQALARIEFIANKIHTFMPYVPE